jgi:putative transposase
MVAMGMRKDTFAHGEWYHCYTRGIEKRRIFQTVSDYRRYMQLLYICNSIKTLHRSDLVRSHKDIFSIPHEDTLVSIGAYCLMPNHPHLLLKEKNEGGISKFMQKLGTAYTMYFNIRNERSGGLFVKPFRSKHVADDQYFQKVVQYIHLNPAELAEPLWKQGHVKNMRKLENFLSRYEYSSFLDYQKSARPERAILDEEVFSIAYPSETKSMLEDARKYYEEFGDRT